MQLTRRKFVGGIFAGTALLTASGSLFAQVAGRDFTPLSPVQPTDDAAKIEVLEFFSYGCPHCADFNPLLSAWAAKLPADVYLKKVPVSFGRAAWANIARVYYALELLGETKRLDADIFRAIHGERVNLFEERAATDWLVAHGVDRKKFSDAFASFGVSSKLRRGDQMAQAYRITGVPTLAVDGKFMVSGADFQEQLAVADKLIARARAEKSKK